MVEQAYLELIHKEIDGVITPAEKTRLAAFLQSNPEARKIHRELTGLARALDELPVLDPPPALKSGIVGRIAAGKNRPLRSGSITERSGNAGRWRLAYGFAAGLAAGLLLLALAGDFFPGETTLNIADLQGTLVISESPGAGTSTAAPLEAPGVSGELRLRHTADTGILALDITAVEATSITLRYDATALQLSGFIAREGGVAALDNHDGRIRFNHQGSNRYSLIFRKISTGTPPALHLELSAGGEVLLAREIVY